MYQLEVTVTMPSSALITSTWPMGALGAPAASFLLRVAFNLLYLLPTIVASRYRHPKKLTIILLNVAAGWTIIGWVLALVWAMKGRQLCRSRQEDEYHP
jgi:hypothetical protein